MKSIQKLKSELEQSLKSFRDHEGRPGMVGGSRPKGHGSKKDPTRAYGGKLVDSHYSGLSKSSGSKRPAATKTRFVITSNEFSGVTKVWKVDGDNAEVVEEAENYNASRELYHKYSADGGDVEIMRGSEGDNWAEDHRKRTSADYE